MPLTLVHGNRGHEVDFNLKRLYDMPNIEVSDASLNDWSVSANDLFLR